MFSAADILREKEALSEERNAFVFLAQEIHDVIGPAQSFLNGEGPLMGVIDTRDTTARRAAQIYANGLTALAFPKHDEWFGIGPRLPEYDKPEKKERAIKHFGEVKEEMRLMLEESNFYDEIPLTLFEGGGYGTGLLKIGQDERTGEIYFQHQCFGTYYLVEDFRGRLTGVYRDIKLNMIQLHAYMGDKFNPDKLPQKLREAYKDPTKRSSIKFDFVHVVKSFEYAVAGQEYKDLIENGKEFGDYLIYEPDKVILDERTHSFMPFFVRRHARFGHWTYGYGPGWLSLEDGRQSTEASRLFEAFASRATFPSVLATGNEEGAIRMGAGQITYIDPTTQTIPQAWALPGDYRAVMELMLSKHANIESAFYADLFKSLQDVTKSMTAMEVQARESEKNVQLYPSALRLESETGKPLLQALYKIGREEGRFPTLPDALKVETDNGTFEEKPFFRIRSRITTSVRQQRVVKLAQWFEMFAGLLEQDPTLIMMLKPDKIIGDTLRDTGLPEEWIEDKATFEQKVQQYQEQQAMQAQAEQAQQMASAMKDVAQVPGAEAAMAAQQ
jgi:hypothetical protein